MAQWLSPMSVGDWFESGGHSFEIVGIDTAAEVVLVQHFGGDLEEMDFDAWLQLQAQPCAAPEDYRGALDLDHGEDIFDSDSADAPRYDDALSLLDRLDPR